MIMADDQSKIIAGLLAHSVPGAKLDQLHSANAAALAYLVARVAELPTRDYLVQCLDGYEGGHVVADVPPDHYDDVHGHRWNSGIRVLPASALPEDPVRIKLPESLDDWADPEEARTLAAELLSAAARAEADTRAAAEAAQPAIGEARS